MSKFPITNVFFDSDAVIAGSASRQGASYILLQLAELGLIRGYVSQKVIDECRKNLRLKLPDAISHFDQIIAHALNVLENPAQKECDKYVKMAHQKDLSILTSAIKINAQFLVTFNTKDFRPEPKIKVSVIEPGELLKKIRLQLSTLADG